MKFLLTLLIIATSCLSYGKTYSANTPAWRGEWIWAPRQNDVPVLTVNLREWLVAKPGGWGQSIVNRILGNAAIAGIGKVSWALDDGHGNALFPCGDLAQVLSWPNWGVDFNAFDFPKAAAEFAKRCDMDIVFVTDKKFLDTAQKRYPQLKIALTNPFKDETIKATALDPDSGATRWISHEKYEFKHEFTVTRKVKQARLCVTADATYRLYIDDKAVGADGDWWRGETYDTTSLLTPGKHTIRAQVKPSKSYAGLLVNLEWQTEDGTTEQVNTGADWLCRKAGTQQWLPVSIVGYEGTGPRFRLKDPWMNHRAMICTMTSAVAFVDASQMKRANSGNEITLSLSKPILLTEIRVAAPAETSYQVKYQKNNRWKNLVEPVQNSDGCNEYICHAFTPRRLNRVKLVIEKGKVNDIKLIKAEGAE